MNWDAIGAMGEVAGAVAVVVTLVYLAGQLRQNTRAIKSANYAAYNQVASSWADFVANHAEEMPGFDERSTPEALTPKQLWVRVGFAVKSISQAETIFLNHRSGSLDDDVFEARMDSFQRVLTDMPLMNEMFNDGVGASVGDFRVYMNKRISTALEETSN